MAVPLSTTITGRNAAVNASWDGATARAVAIGTESARFFGTSSPTSMEKLATRMSASTAARAVATCSASAVRPSGTASRSARAGWVV